MPGSPAAEIGIQVGDVIVLIDGTDSEWLTLKEMDRMFGQTGNIYKLWIIRNHYLVIKKLKITNWTFPIKWQRQSKLP